MRGWVLRWGLLAVLVAHPAFAGDPPEPVPRLNPELQAAVGKAVERGVARLLTLQSESGEFPGPYKPERIPGPDGKGAFSNNISWVGQTALALYTLRSCGVPAADPRITKGFAWLRAEYLKRKGETPGLDNYGVSLIVLALEANLDPPPPEDGRDGYGRTARKFRPIPEPDLAWLKELTAWLIAAQDSEGGFGYTSPPSGSHDHSNTQYSLMALRAARRCGIPVPSAVWEKAMAHLVEVQETRGPTVDRPIPSDGGGKGSLSRSVATTKDRARGWGYRERDPATGSMTTGGVSSVAICMGELRGSVPPGKKAIAAAEQAMHDGIAWLGVHFTTKENPGPTGAPMGREAWRYYYLCGLERAGVLADTVLMGRHDWYQEGAQYLIDAQDRTGGWSQNGITEDLPANIFPEIASLLDLGGLLDTCFALLFLKRATQGLSRGTATQPASDGLDLTGADQLADRAFRDLFDGVFRRFAAADPVARNVRSSDFVRLGTRSIPLLVLRLADSELALRAAALSALQATTGETRGYDAAATEEARAAAIDAWETWWLAEKTKLVADVGAGRFRTGP